MMIDYLVVGHICKDLQPDGSYTLGGSVLYSALTARALGYQVGLFTRAASDPAFDALLHQSLPGIEVFRQPAFATTTFENIYDGGSRQQYLRAYAFPLNLKLLPPSWAQAKVLHLAPVAREIDEGEAAHLLQARRGSGAISGLTPQGWLREWRDDGGKVFFHRWPEAKELLPLSDALIFSEEDVAAAPELTAEYSRLAPLTAVTEGARGATIYQAGRRIVQQSAFATTQVDPTGAGDVFAASFLLTLQASGDPRRAATVGCAAASFAVEQPGLRGVPTATMVRERLAAHGYADYL